LFEHDLSGKPVPTFPDNALEGNNVGTVAAVRDGVNQPSISNYHAEFTL
jgi:hypothetical protein